jgi:hypothetical protein
LWGCPCMGWGWRWGLFLTDEKTEAWSFTWRSHCSCVTGKPHFAIPLHLVWGIRTHLGVVSMLIASYFIDYRNTVRNIHRSYGSPYLPEVGLGQAWSRPSNISGPLISKAGWALMLGEDFQTQWEPSTEKQYLVSLLYHHLISFRRCHLPSTVASSSHPNLWQSKTSPGKCSLGHERQHG